jgi:C4-dicarboxylate-specific signal transduction histidine kinase
MATDGDSDDDRSLSLRTQLLAGLGMLLWVALLGIALTVVVWQPITWSPWLVAGAVIGLAAVEVGVLVLFADFLLRRNFVEPLKEMVEDAERIAGGDHGHRLDVESPVELGRLSRAVNEMAERLIDHKEELEENIRSLDETNRALTEARDELVHAEKLASVGRLAAGLAHEIGNPLNAITTYVEIGRRRTEGEGEWLEGISDEAQRIDTIVGGLLDYARPRDGPSVSVRVNEVVEDTLELLHGQGRLDGVDVELELEGGLPRVRANPFHLQQVLVNLLMNACDAVEEPGAAGRRLVRVVSRSAAYAGPDGTDYRPRRRDDPEEVDYRHIRRFNEPPRGVRRPSFEEGEELVVLEVVDDGPGLPTEDPEEVFDPFFTTKDPGKGTGLGLSVSARLVEEMGGNIEAAERDGPGCVFRVRLRALLEEEAARPEPAAGSDAAGARAGTGSGDGRRPDEIDDGEADRELPDLIGTGEGGGDASDRDRSPRGPGSDRDAFAEEETG